MGGQANKCYTQEYRYVEELYGGGGFHAMGSERVDEQANDPCETLPFHCSCCRTEEIEEAVIVHHDALRQVNFLLSYDELAAEELPSLPRCVSAVRQAKARANRVKRGFEVTLPHPKEVGVPPHPVRPAIPEADDGGVEREDQVDLQLPVGDLSPAGVGMSVHASSSSASADEPDGGLGKDGFLDEVLDHADVERKALAAFLGRMRKGMGLRMLSPTVDGPAADNLGAESREVTLQLQLSAVKQVFRIEALDLTEIVPLHTVTSVHVGGRDEADLSPEDRNLCMRMRTIWTNSLTGDGGGDEVVYRFIFMNEEDRDEFKVGMQRLRVFCTSLLDTA